MQVFTNNNNYNNKFKYIHKNRPDFSRGKSSATSTGHEHHVAGLLSQAASVSPTFVRLKLWIPPWPAELDTLGVEPRSLAFNKPGLGCGPHCRLRATALLGTYRDMSGPCPGSDFLWLSHSTTPSPPADTMHSVPTEQPRLFRILALFA